MIIPHHGRWPGVHETAFVAPSADIVGEVEIGSHSSVWFQVVIRGDVNWVKIGSRTNIQDHSMLHVTRGVSPCTVGDDVTVGHRATLHGCTIGNRVLIGMGAIVLDNAVIGDDCIVGAGALVTKGMIVPSGSLVVGAPAKFSRALKPEEIAFLKKSAENYVNDAAEYYRYVNGPKKLNRNDEDLNPQSFQDYDEGFDDGDF
ncbi:MAG: gamma carbonic anhydrase family protein [Oligoflexia bacterium]|nr:gamma carbonic anhydrase family protein [Oligoflexia bacterium]